MHIESAEVLAFDFAEEGDIESYIETLEERTELESIYEESPRAPLGGNGRLFDHLGVIKPEATRSFGTIYVSVTRFSSVPEAAALLLRAEVPEEDNESDTLIRSEDLQNELSEIWSELFEDFPSSIQADSPQTLISSQVVVGDLDDLFEFPDNTDDAENLTDYEPFIESARDESLCRSLGIEYRGLMSVESDQKEYLMLTAQTVWTSSGDQVQHGKYAVIEFLPEGSPMLTDFEPEENTVPPMNFTRSFRRVQQMITPIFYYYWFQTQTGYQKYILGETLRELPIGVENEQEVDDLIEFIQEERNEFYGKYIQFLDRVDSADTLLQNTSNAAVMESGLPLTSEQRPFVESHIDGVEYDFDYESGVLSLLISDTRSAIESAKSQYNKLQNRYEIVLRELSQQIDLITSRQNRTLTQSSLELQEDMKTLNESSLDLQKKVKYLNRWVTILTLILVAEAFGLFSIASNLIISVVDIASNIFL